MGHTDRIVWIHGFWVTSRSWEVEGRAHLMSARTGWEEIADYALAWATEQAAVWASRPLPASA